MLEQEIFRSYFEESKEESSYDANGELMKDIYQALDVLMLIAEQNKTGLNQEKVFYLVQRMSEYIENRLENTLFSAELHLLKLREKEKLNDFQLLCILIAGASESSEWKQKKYEAATPSLALKLYNLLYQVDRETQILAFENLNKIEKYIEEEPLYQKQTLPMERILKLKPSVKSYLWGHKPANKVYWEQFYQLKKVPDPFIGFENLYQRFMTLATKEKMPHVILCGAEGSGKRLLVKHISKKRHKKVIFIKESLLVEQEDNRLIEELCIDAFFMDADICVCDCNIDGKEQIEKLLKKATLNNIVVYLLSEQNVGRIKADNVFWMKVVIKEPDIRTKIQLWNHFLKEYQTEGIEPEILSNRYLLRAGEIKQILEQAYYIAISHNRQAILMCDIVEAVKLRNGAALGNYADLLETNIKWDDLVVKEDIRTQLEYISDRLKYKNTVEAEWGFEEKVSYGKGICALFYGPPGTGKTMAVKAMANELGLELYRIDISRMVSKYIGETQKHITELFERAKHLNALLFFDEADAFFSKRTNVNDSNDRNANSEVAHLLQKLEEYDGISILATNLKDNIDDAFKRRIKYMVHFQLPDVETRKLLWKKILPAQAPVADNLELDYFAEHFEMSGSEIKDALLQAAFMAARDNEKISNQHIAKAVRLSFQKYGKTLTEEDFGYLL